MADIHVERTGGIAIVTLSNPGRLNAFTRDMRARIGAELVAIGKDPSARGAVITGAGEAFCAGQDLNESVTWTPETPWVEEFETFFQAILAFPRPLVAAVNGVAAGGGFQMAMLCDRRIGHAGVRMGQTEVRRGLASVTGTWLLQRCVGEVRARELALSGRLMDAEELRQVGLLDAIVPADTVVEAAVASCHELAASPADSYGRTKAWLYERTVAEMAAVFVDAGRFHRMGFESGVSQAGARAFVTGEAAG